MFRKTWNKTFGLNGSPELIWEKCLICNEKNWYASVREYQLSWHCKFFFKWAAAAWQRSPWLTFANYEQKTYSHHTNYSDIIVIVYVRWYCLGWVITCLFSLSCLRSNCSLNGPQCLSYLFKLIDCMRINCNFYYEIVRNKWFNGLKLKTSIKPLERITAILHRSVLGAPPNSHLIWREPTSRPTSQEPTS